MLKLLAQLIVVSTHRFTGGLPLSATVRLGCGICTSIKLAVEADHLSKCNKMHVYHLNLGMKLFCLFGHCRMFDLTYKIFLLILLEF